MKINLNHPPSIKENRQAVEILSIGTELLLGNIVNTNARWIAEQLSSLGLNHFRQTTIGDNSERLSKLIIEISKRSNSVPIERISTPLLFSLLERWFKFIFIKREIIAQLFNSLFTFFFNR